MINKYSPFVTSYFHIQNFITSDERDHMITETNNIVNIDPEGVSVSNDGGWQSKTFDFVPAGHELVLQRITEVVSAVFNDYKIDLTPKLLNYWFNINKRGSYNKSHVHPGCFFSAVLYIKKPENSGRLVLERPDNLEMFMPTTGDSQDRLGVWYPNVEETDLIIFPSYIPHYVEQSKTDDERISLALNYGGTV